MMTASDRKAFERVQARITELQQSLLRAQRAEREQRMRADCLEQTARAAWATVTPRLRGTTDSP